MPPLPPPRSLAPALLLPHTRTVSEGAYILSFLCHRHNGQVSGQNFNPGYYGGGVGRGGEALGRRGVVVGVVVVGGVATQNRNCRQLA